MKLHHSFFVLKLRTVLFALSIITLIAHPLSAKETDIQKSNLQKPALSQNKEILMQTLYDCSLIKFGSFRLKSGILAPIYMDLRASISYPKLLQLLVHQIGAVSKSLDYDSICGIPYGALPIASAVAFDQEKPMIMKRKEVKKHGTGKTIEGTYKAKDTVLIIEDVVTTGGSCIEAIKSLEEHNLVVKDIIVLMAYPKGKKNLEKQGYHVHELLSFTDITNYFSTHSSIATGLQTELKEYALSMGL